MTRAVIIDSNSFGAGMHPVVKDAVHKSDIKVLNAPNTQVSKELKRANEKRYAEYYRRGFFEDVCGVSVKRKGKQLRKMNCYISNDPHFVALAIVSATNILVSNDKDLWCDFKNCKSIDQKSCCTKCPQLPGKASRKIIHTLTKGNKKPIQSMPHKVAKRLLVNASAPSNICECQINGGGC